MSTRTSSNLCIKCGICCDGTAFGQVALDIGDLSAVTQEMNLQEAEGKRTLKQPCAAHINCSCTIYANRPGICVTYECKLLKEYMRGKVEEDLAHKTIERVKSTRREIEVLLKEAANENDVEDIHTRVRDFEKDLLSTIPLLKYRQLHGPLLLKYKVLQKLLTDRFGVKFKGEKNTL